MAELAEATGQPIEAIRELVGGRRDANLIYLIVEVTRGEVDGRDLLARGGP